MKYYAILYGIYEIMRKCVILCGNDQIVRFYAEMVKLCGIALTALNQCPCCICPLPGDNQNFIRIRDILLGVLKFSPLVGIILSNMVAFVHVSVTLVDFAILDKVFQNVNFKHLPLLHLHHNSMSTALRSVNFEDFAPIFELWVVQP